MLDYSANIVKQQVLEQYIMKNLNTKKINNNAKSYLGKITCY